MFIQTMNLIIIFILIMYLYSFSFNKFIMSLISIEMIMLSTASLILNQLSKLNQEYQLIYFLVIMVSESVLGLAILILMSRIHNNDSNKIMNISW